jgi:hypothetical protein
MLQLILYVSSNIEQADDILKLWVKAGVPGVTILESTGMQQAVGRGAFRDDLSILPTLSALMRGKEVHHRTLFSALEDEAVLQAAIATTTDYVGDWGRADVGILLVLPISQAYGLQKGYK